MSQYNSIDNIELTPISIENITVVPSDIEIPVYNHPIQTNRSLCANFPNNQDIVRRIEHDVNISNQTCINNIPYYIQELQAVYSSSTPEECSSDIFEGQTYQVIDNLEDLKKLLSELLIRFDTDPKFYTREDYSFLMAVLYRSLLYIYNQEVPSIGENFSRVARMRGSNLELKNPIATDETEVEDEDKDSTLASVSYVDKLVLRWEAF